MNNLITAFTVTVYSLLLEFLAQSGSLLLGRFRFWKRYRLNDRCCKPTVLCSFSGKPTIWIHAASLGESQVALKFVDILRIKYPSALYFFTATSPTGVEFLRQNAGKTAGSHVFAVHFLPLDTVARMKRIINRFSISRIWLVETELWPGMLRAARLKNVPVAIINGRLEEKSFKQYHRFRFLFQSLLAPVDCVLAQSQEYAARYAGLGIAPDRIKVTGNLKQLVRIVRPARVEWESLRKQMNAGENDLILTAGCLRAGEGVVVREALRILSEQNFNLRCIVVPRHTNEVRDLLAELGEKTLYIREISTRKSWDICLVDAMGVLDALYRLADLAIVGGTFVPIGGHNVWDAARYGIPVFFGPDYHTQTESCERLLAAGVGFKAGNAKELAHAMYRVLRTEARAYISASSQFAQEINRRQPSDISELLP